MEKKEYEEIQKQEEMLKLLKFKPFGYGIKQDMKLYSQIIRPTENAPKDKEIEINEYLDSDSNKDGSQTKNYQTRENLGSSRKSKRMEVIKEQNEVDASSKKKGRAKRANKSQFLSSGRSQMGLGNEDLDNNSESGKYKEVPVMNQEFIEGQGMTVKQAIEFISKCKENIENEYKMSINDYLDKK